MFTIRLPVVLVLLLLHARFSLCNQVHLINNPKGLIELANEVAAGDMHAGVTVFLDDDIDFSNGYNAADNDDFFDDFSDAFEPIGNSWKKYFQGTFDGQGHVIKNLNMNSTSEFAALFGYSGGITIRNVIIDDSCAINNEFESLYESYTCGIISYCKAQDKQCTIENSVNMATITFSGKLKSRAELSGIVAHLASAEYESVVRNCANYGEIARDGGSMFAYIGGIVGSCSSSDSAEIYIYNCLNTGFMSYESDVRNTNSFVGGISGYSSCDTTFTNCMNTGEIYAPNQTSKEIGPILGNFGTTATVVVKHCFWSAPNFNSPVNNPQARVDSESRYVNLGKDVVDDMNSYVDDMRKKNNTWNKWVWNRDSTAVTFEINRGTFFELNSQVFLLPTIVDSGEHSFSGWYTDCNYTKPFKDFEVGDYLSLYGGWLSTLSFVTYDNKTVGPLRLVQWSTYRLEQLKKPGCIISHWVDAFDEMVSWDYLVPNFDTTLYAVWLCTNITTAHDLSDFSKIVNSGTDFLGTTVYISNDITFDNNLSSKFLPIGDDINHFLGTFDGQGYLIDHLNIKTVKHYTGLFGYTLGATIKNVVMGPSCSVRSFYVSFPDIGGILGRGIGQKNNLIVDNCVNMGNVKYAESTGEFLFIGGFVGITTRTGDVEIRIRNCANYGTITFSGVRSERIFVGGIVGEAEGSDGKKFIQNCVNYGAFVNRGEIMELIYAGGIIGAIWGGEIKLENCLSVGHLDHHDSLSAINQIGTVVGHVEHKEANKTSNLTHCCWTEDVGGYDYVGDIKLGTVYMRDSFVTTFDNSRLSELNSYSATNSGWNKWFRLHLNGGSINNISQDILFVAQKRFPAPVKEGFTFLGWYLDESFNEKYYPTTAYVDEKTNIYAKWYENDCTITFEVHGGTGMSPITQKCKTNVTIPEPSERKACNFLWWEDESGNIIKSNFTIPGYNITLHAVWACAHISLGYDLIGLSRAIKHGIPLPSRCVYLEEDVTIYNDSKYAFEPIGINETHSFNDIFNGQGYVIKVSLTSSAKYTGLFGYFRGEILNTIITESYITSHHSNSDEAYLGGAIGYCDSCTIKHSGVSGKIHFDGTDIGNLYLGGLAGKVSSELINVKNCASYGNVVYTGISNTTMIGGLIGYFYGSPHGATVQNCLNNAAITVDGPIDSASTMHIGGIVGLAVGISFDDCVSVGKITSDVGPIESITGSDSNVNITSCYWTTDVGCNSTHMGNRTHLIELSNTTIIELNSNGRVWLLNPNKCEISFRYYGKGFKLKKMLILMPDLADYDDIKFIGWYKGEEEFKESIINIQTTLNGRLEEPDEFFDLSLILSMSLVGFVVLVVSIMIYVAYNYFYLRRKKRNEIKMYIRPLLHDMIEDSLDEMGFLYPRKYKKVSLENALINAGVNFSIAKEVVAECYHRAKLNCTENKLPRKITIDEAAAICLYTTETTKMKKNPYTLINGALMDGSVEAIRPVKDFLYLVMTAMRKLPVFYGKPLYRGIRTNVINKDIPIKSAADLLLLNESSGNRYVSKFMESDRSHDFQDEYTEGEEIMWRALSSTSPNIAVTKAFLAKGTTSGKAEGTLFIIENGWGYNVQSCSMFPGETEIVLEPERRFKVKTIIRGEGLTIIKIEMLKTPIVLQDIFGELDYGKLS